MRSEKNTMKMLAMLLAVVLMFASVPAFAQTTPGGAEGSTGNGDLDKCACPTTGAITHLAECPFYAEPAKECTCTEKCSPADTENGVDAVIDPNCPVCGTADADLSLCIGAASTPTEALKLSLGALLGGAAGDGGLTISLSDGVDTMVAGAAHPYTMVVSNSGDTGLAQVWVKCTLPEQASNSPASTWEITGKTGGADVTGEYGSSGELRTQIPAGAWGMTMLSLPVGSSVTFALSINTLPNASGNFTISVNAEAFYPDSDTATVADTNTLTKKADLTVSIDDGKTSLVPGEAAPYKIRVSNNGPSTVSGVTVYCPLPAGVGEASWGPTGYFSYASASPSNGTGALNSTLYLAKGAYYEFWFTLYTPATAAGSLVTAVTVVTEPGDVPDDNPSNNTATDTDTYGNSSNADVEIALGFDDQTGNKPNEITFYTEASLRSSGNATNVTVSIPKLDGVVFTVVEATQGSYNADTGVWSVGTLTNYGNEGLLLKATVTDSNPKTVTATVSGMDQTDTNPSNNSATLTITDKSDVSITASAAPAEPDVGGYVDITLTATNNGPIETCARTSMDIPAGLEYVSHTPNTEDIYFDDDEADWSIGDMAPSETRTVTVRLRVITPGIKTCEAEIEGWIPDPDASNNTSAFTIIPRGGSGGSGGGTSYAKRSLTDTQTGVKVSGGIPESTKLAVSPLDLNATGNDAVSARIRDAIAKGQLIAGYDIRLSGGFRGEITISFPVGAAYNGRTVTILHFINGRMETHTAVVENGVATIRVSSLSPFLVLNTGVNVPTFEVTDPPKTGGSSAPIGLAMLGLAAACMAAATLGRQKRV